METTIKQDLARLMATRRGDSVPRNWSDYPLMLTPRHIVDITGWSRTFTYEQLRPYGQLSHLVQRYGKRFMVSRDALRRLFDGEESS